MGSVAVVAVNETNDVKQPFGSTMPPPVSQTAKAIRAADLAATLRWRRPLVRLDPVCFASSLQRLFDAVWDRSLDRAIGDEPIPVVAKYQ